MNLVPDNIQGPPESRRCTCRVTAIADMARGLRIIRLAAENGERIDFRAGQYAFLSFGGMDKRPYSIASIPGDRELEFYIRASESGQGGSVYATETLSIGENVSFDGPYGDAYLVEHDKSPILAIAGGLGIAPIKSVVETALAHAHSKPIHLYMGMRDETELYLKDRFIELGRRHGNLTFVPVLSAPEDANSPYRQGNVGDVVASDFDDLSEYRVYIAGPPVMVNSTIELLLERGIDPERIHCDNAGPQPKAAGQVKQDTEE